MRLSSLLGVCAMFFALPAVAVPVMSVQPPIATTVSASFILDITITGAEDLYAFEFDLGFDPTVLAATSIDEGTFLGAGGSTFFVPGLIDNVAGTITFTANSLLTAVAGVSGNGVLAQVSFLAIGEGSSVVSLFNTLLLDSALSGVTPINFASSAIVSAAPTTVSEPSSWALLCFAVLVLWAFQNVHWYRSGDGRAKSKRPA